LFLVYSLQLASFRVFVQSLHPAAEVRNFKNRTLAQDWKGNSSHSNDFLYEATMFAGEKQYDLKSNRFFCNLICD
jgi:hypothetical protein